MALTLNWFKEVNSGIRSAIIFCVFAVQLLVGCRPVWAASCVELLAGTKGETYFQLSKKASREHQGPILRSHSLLLVKLTPEEYQKIPNWRRSDYKSMDGEGWETLDLSDYLGREKKIIVTFLHQAGLNVILQSQEIFIRRGGPLNYFTRLKIRNLLRRKANLEEWRFEFGPMAPDPARKFVTDWTTFPGRKFIFRGTVDSLIKKNLFLSDLSPEESNINWHLIGRVDGKTSVSELAKDYPQSETYMETFWPTRDSGTSTELLDESGIRIRRNIVDGKAQEIEAMVFVRGTWMPLLYKLNEATNQWQRRYETNRGERISEACVRCHGAGANFGPAVKLPLYKPADWKFGACNKKYVGHPRDIYKIRKIKDPLFPTFLGLDGSTEKEK